MAILFTSVLSLVDFEDWMEYLSLILISYNFFRKNQILEGISSIVSEKLEGFLLLVVFASKVVDKNCLLKSWWKLPIVVETIHSTHWRSVLCSVLLRIPSLLNRAFLIPWWMLYLWKETKSWETSVAEDCIKL